jgi:hypothetical protein
LRKGFGERVCIEVGRKGLLGGLEEGVARGFEGGFCGGVEV